MLNLQKPINIWKVSALALAIFLILSITVSTVLLLKNNNNKISVKGNTNSANFSFIKPVSAKEIYPLFECPCCGKAINQCTCSMAKEKRNYVDALAEIGKDKSEDEIVLAYVQKYGLGSFLDEEKQQEFREKLIKEAPADRAIIVLTPESYDLGNVSQKKGIVTIIFGIKNDGYKDLIIDKIETSCGCTSASVVYQGEEGPKFSMPGHGINERIKDWQLTIEPGQEAQLKVYYDPNVHKDFRGSAIREISVFSNDPIDFEKKVKIELNLIS